MKLDPYLGDVRAEIAFSTQPDDPAPAYVDVTDNVRSVDGITIVRGRQDEQSDVAPSTCQYILDNTSGWFTAGYTGSPYYPNVKIRRKGRITFRPAGISWNLLDAESASFEGGTVGSWLGTSATLSNSSTHPQVGTKGMLITWATVGSGAKATRAALYGFVIGRQYTMSAWVYVPSGGAPAVKLAVVSGTTTAGTASATTNALTQITVTWQATSATYDLQVLANAATTSGQLCYVDAVLVDEGATPGTFTTTSMPAYCVRYTGYAEEWPTEWPGGGVYSEVRVKFTDRLKRLGTKAKLLSPVQQEYFQDGPLGFYTLGDVAGSIAAVDISGNTRGRTMANAGSSPNPVAFGNGAFTYTGGVTSALFIPNQWLNVRLPLFNGIPYTMEALVEFSSWPANFAIIMGNGVSGFDANFQISNSGILTGTAGATQLALNTEYHVAITVDGSGNSVNYVNGAAFASGPGSALADPLFAIGDFLGFATSLLGFRATFFAVYLGALSAGRILQHAFAAVGGCVGESSDARFARVARWAGVPAAEYAAEAGMTTSMAFSDTTNQTPVQALQDIEATEHGVLYVSTAGVLSLQSRSHRYADASAFTLTGDDIDPSARFVENDVYLINDVTATRPGAQPVRVVNAASVAEYGEAVSTRALLTTSDLEVADAANWLVGQNSTPSPRLPNLVVDLLTNSGLLTNVLQADISTRLTVGALPNVALSSAVDVFVEGYTEVITETGWSWAANTTPVPAAPVFILDDATFGVLDSSSVLGY